METVTWAKELVVKLRELGLDHLHAMIVVGWVAEHRMKADAEGYKRGFQDGYEYCLERIYK